MLLRSCLALLLVHLFAISALAENNSFDREVVEARLGEMESIVPMMHLSKVKNRVSKHIVEWEVYTTELIERSFVYFPIVENVLAEKQLPDELKFLTVIESELQPKTNYSTGAGGFWQLMPRTARSLGLVVNDEVDERFEIYTSSDAALDYVVELYERFEDWPLVLAAYNCGPTKVSRLLRERGTSDFEDIYDFLPTQTRAYFDKFLAYQYVFEYYNSHDIKPFLPMAGTSELVKMEFPSNASIQSISKSSGMDAESIRKWNPHLKAATKSNIRTHTVLVLPYNVELSEGATYETVSMDVRINGCRELDAVSSLIGCLPQHIVQWNRKKLNSANIQTIYIPKHRIPRFDKYLGRNDVDLLESKEIYVELDYNLDQYQFAAVKVEDYMTYNMQSQDDLRTIAYRYGVSVDSILAANEANQNFRSGSIIRIPKK